MALPPDTTLEKRLHMTRRDFIRKWLTYALALLPVWRREFEVLFCGDGAVNQTD